MHTFLSDGVLSPVELIRRAHVAGYRVMAITDHVGAGNLEYVLNTLVRDCAMASRRWDILALPGVEITHTPKEDIDLLAGEARALGAKVVNVHGETIVEPVEPGTNRAAVSSHTRQHPGAPRADNAGRGGHRGGERRLPRNLFTQRAQPHQRPRGACGARGERRHGAGLGHPRAWRPAVTGSRAACGPRRRP